MNLPIPQVVKMDIEGHEYAALCGMRVACPVPHCRGRSFVRFIRERCRMELLRKM